ncbi:hypothetical protein HUJ04_004536 [Dendroctonus ponderosae]|nr:hypothetical protein HUJ04_004536 [Dendroctonus ponderosae]KAH1014782.1 hypothetical protein HUJ05_012609 [Dendroctonus ponderosae]
MFPFFLDKKAGHMLLNESTNSIPEQFDKFLRSRPYGQPTFEIKNTFRMPYLVMATPGILRGLVGVDLLGI